MFYNLDPCSCSILTTFSSIVRRFIKTSFWLRYVMVTPVKSKSVTASSVTLKQVVRRRCGVTAETILSLERISLKMPFFGIFSRKYFFQKWIHFNVNRFAKSFLRMNGRRRRLWRRWRWRCYWRWRRNRSLGGYFTPWLNNFDPVKIFSVTDRPIVDNQTWKAKPDLIKLFVLLPN